MAVTVDFAKPATSDNYSTAFVPNIVNNFLGTAKWLDTGDVTITGTPQQYTKRYNRGTGILEEYGTTAWGTLNLAYVLKSGDTLTGPLTITNDTTGVRSKPAAETSYSGILISNVAATRRFEALYLGTSQGGAYGAAQGSVVLNAAASAMTLSTSDTARIAIAEAGNVTIAAPSSGTALSVIGISGSNVATFSSAGGALVGIQAYATQGFIGTNTNHTFEIYTNNVSKVFITAAGNVSIAAPSSGTTLNITTTSTVAFNAVGGAGNWAIQFASGNSFFGPTTNHNTSLRTNNLDRITIAAAGNVSIAAPSSGTALSVTSISGSTGILLTDTVVDQRWFTSASIGYFGTFSNHPLTLRTNGTDRITIAAAGNVTIAAPSSGNPLTFIGSARAELASGLNTTFRGLELGLTGDATVYGSIKMALDSGEMRFGAGYATWGGYQTFYTNGLERIRITSAGNVDIVVPTSGIATTINGASGQTVLAINVAGSSVNGISINSTAGNQASFALAQAGQAALSFYNPASSNELRFYINGADRVRWLGTGGAIINAPASGIALQVNGAALTPTSSQAFTATPTFNALLSNIFEFSGAMTANVTSCTITNPTAGQTITIRVKQDATGSRTFATPSGAKISGTVQSTLSTASILTLTYSSMDARWEGSWLGLPV